MIGRMKLSNVSRDVDHHISYKNDIFRQGRTLTTLFHICPSPTADACRSQRHSELTSNIMGFTYAVSQPGSSSRTR